MARLESLDIGAPGREALFASPEGAKWPIDSSHCSWITLKRKSGSLRIFGHWSSRQRSAFCFVRGREMANRF
ncbi:hypothetical protein COL18_05825 [Bacillus cereus]|nr:hypothetical protein COI99_02385 [Bacillus cereus]PFW18411.1 hypothetical protein COL18_05825 [Bacillus cereus]PGX06143.1 hypothetical protein COE40_03215 [Bacillus cereus]PGY17924.1 hypothetical protein COE16_21160 [Bacillus cereus]